MLFIELYIYFKIHSSLTLWFTGVWSMLTFSLASNVLRTYLGKVRMNQRSILTPRWAYMICNSIRSIMPPLRLRLIDIDNISIRYILRYTCPQEWEQFIKKNLLSRFYRVFNYKYIKLKACIIGEEMCKPVYIHRDIGDKYPHFSC